MATKKSIELLNLLPANTQNETLNSFVKNLFDRHLNSQKTVSIDGYIGTRVDNSDDIAPSINLDHELNALVPSLNFSVGIDEFTFSFTDFINVFRALGIDTDNLSNILKERFYNLYLPISYDKFSNFANYFWVGQSITTSEVPPWNESLDAEFYVIRKNDTEGNDWQKFNFWVHRDDLASVSGLDYTKIIQATRPIIEYDDTLELNNHFTSDFIPCSPDHPSAIYYDQTKTEFNQIPLFNLYRYSGDHAGVVSGIIQYKIDSAELVDSVLRFKAAKNVNSDFTFKINFYDSKDRILYVKNNGELLGPWQIGEEISPKYVRKVNGQIEQFPGGAQADLNKEGTWLTPLRMFQNIDRSFRSEINYADINEHIVSVISNQEGLEGFAFGNNNSRNLDFNFGKGGKIRDFGKEFPLLCSLLMQKNLSINSVIDFAENQYSSLLSSADIFIREDLADILSKNAITVSNDSTDLNNSNDSEIIALLNSFQEKRAENILLKQVFSDSSSKLSNSVATLPMLGMLPATAPSIQYNLVRNEDVIVHHDGHKSPKMLKDRDLYIKLALSNILRSDGSLSPGLIQETVPSIQNLYKNRLWFKPTTQQLKLYSIDYDTLEEPTGNAGEYWLDKNVNQLKTWDASNLEWVATNDDRWVDIYPEKIRNNFILAIENLLYESVYAEFEPKINFSDYDTSGLDIQELSLFARKFDLSIFSTDFDANNSFTWNYKNSIIPGLSYVPARWNDVYFAYFGNQNFTLATSRPDLEPWKLMGEIDKPIDWDSTYACQVSIQTDAIKKIVASLVSTSNFDINEIIRETTLIDGQSLNTGDYVLLKNQINLSENDLYRVVNGSLIPQNLEIIPNKDTVIEIMSGFENAGTKWKLSQDLSGHRSFDQLRKWSDTMWNDILSYLPANVKICVNPKTDVLLPPFVSSEKFSSAYAILTSMDSVGSESISNSYEIGENGPVESAWKESIEYNYGKLKSIFKLDPLNVITKIWGETILNSSAKNIPIEKNLGNTLASRNILLHGERLKNINFLTEEEIEKRLSITGNVGNTIRLKAIYSDVETIFDVFVNDIFHAEIRLNEPGDIQVLSDFGLPYNQGDEFTVKIDDYGNKQYFFTPSQVKTLQGIGQWFTNALRFNQLNFDSSHAISALRNWESRLHHRIGNLISADSLKISTPLGNLPSTAFRVKLKKSEKAKNLVISALRVQLVEAVTTDSISVDGIIKPTYESVSKCKFRIDSYTPNNSSAVINTLDDSEGSPFVTFNVLSKKNTDTVWKRYTRALGKEQVIFPIEITGLQPLLNFLYGYIDNLKDEGWETETFDSALVDASTGRNINWQLEIEKLIDTLFLGLVPGNAFIINPFSTKLKIFTPRGLLAEIVQENASDLYLSSGCYDVLGEFIPLNQILVTRQDDYSTISSLTPIFSAKVFIDEYEHALIFSDKFSPEQFSPFIYDSFLSIAADTAYVSYDRKEISDAKPSFPGFFLKDDNYYQNIVSSVDGIADYYDSVKTFSNPKTANHALSLLGYNKKPYFSNLTENEVTQFNFWKGMIQSKGTNVAVSAFTNYKNFIKTEVDEFWAYKISNYGDGREKSLPEIKINVSDVSQNFTRLQFYDKADSYYDAIPLFIQIEKNDSARWFSIDDLGSGMQFGLKSIGEQIQIDQEVTEQEPLYIKLKNIYHTGDDAAPVLTSSNQGSTAAIVGTNLLKIENASAGDIFIISGYTWDIPSRYSPVKLLDYQENSLVSEIALWHPAIGINAYRPLELINYKSGKDPALYNYTTKKTNNANYKKLKPWGKREVGKVWWSTDSLEYIPYYDSYFFPNRDERNLRWGKLAEWSSIKLMQWTESDVHPSEYDALSQSEEGDYEIEQEKRTSGKVANKKYYSRSRTISARPIAWSEVGNPVSDAHPSFSESTFVKVFITNTTIVPDTGSVDASGLVGDRHFSAWKDSKPFGEVIIGNNVGHVLCNSINLLPPSITGLNPASGISAISVLEGESFGLNLGQKNVELITKSFTYTDPTNPDNDLTSYSYYIRITDTEGRIQETIIRDWYVDDPLINGTLEFDFNVFGIKIQLKTDTASTISASEIFTALENVTFDIFIRESISYSEILPLPDTVLINDENDLDVASHEYGWRVWNVPTQNDLEIDLAYPKNKWSPILGDEVDITFSISSDLIDEIKNSTNLYLNSGIEISRYKSYWTEWEELVDTFLEKISNGLSTVSFLAEELDNVSILDKNRISIYTNGIQVNPADYQVAETIVTLNKIYTEGTRIVLLYRAYNPTNEEILFDPEIEDDITKINHYKLDYEYTIEDVRDETGNISSQKYYFWVKDKKIPSSGKSISLLDAQILLETGQSEFIILERARETADYGLVFDSCTFFGLNKLVSKNDSYKLRFLRDFTLRSDPNEIDLKNKHEEWILMRRLQNDKIPSVLWNLITNAACGQDPSGNQLPSKIYLDYDEKNGTRTRYGFKDGQIFADSELVITSIVNTILNTNLETRVGETFRIDYIKSLNLDESDIWFSTPEKSRETMELIWSTAKPIQINEIFFNVLEDALSSNFELSDIFKTSFISVRSLTDVITQPPTINITDSVF